MTIIVAIDFVSIFLSLEEVLLCLRSQYTYTKLQHMSDDVEVSHAVRKFCASFSFP